MNIERSKLFLIIGGAILSLLVVAIVVIAFLVPEPEEEAQDDRTVEEIQEDNIEEYYAGENENEEAADIKESETQNDPPPAGIYENSYEDDFGYSSVIDHESAKDNPDNTVYDDTWAANKWAELNCDIANKLTVSEKALTPLREFREDLKQVGSDMSAQLIDNVDHILSKVENSRGLRLPGEVKNIAGFNCTHLTEEVDI